MKGRAVSPGRQRSIHREVGLTFGVTYAADPQGLSGIFAERAGLLSHPLGIGLRPIIIARKPASLKVLDASPRFSVVVKSEMRA
jgi:hypothetical protein